MGRKPRENGFRQNFRGGEEIVLDKATARITGAELRSALHAVGTLYVWGVFRASWWWRDQEPPARRGQLQQGNEALGGRSIKRPTHR